MKYYIKSGSLNFIVDRNSPKEAALFAVRSSKKKLSDILTVSETGFLQNDWMILTKFLMKDE